jgi:serine/threonine protein kinase
MTSDGTSLVGRRLGPYAIDAHLGAGGMGEVYRARDTRLGRIVAIKVMRSHVASDPRRRQRFDREARLVSQLNHPNICTLHDVGLEDGIDFLVMEYLEGETLAHRLASRVPSREGRGLPLEEALAIAIQIADALEAAHRKGIIHRDLKPGNVMLTKTGAKLLDFGIAKAYGPLGDRHYVPTGEASGVGRGTLQSDCDPHLPPTLTAEGTLIGTVQYMSPEQLLGGEADARSDLFAFGAMMYEMLTGQRAFGGESQSAVIAAVLDTLPPPIRASRPQIPQALDQLVKTCLAKEPDERLTITELAGSLQLVQRQAGFTRSSRMHRGSDRQPGDDEVESARVAQARRDVGVLASEILTFRPSTTMPVWLALFLIPLGIEGLGLLISTNFDRTIGLSERFAREAPGAEFLWGLRSIIAPSILIALSAAAITLARATGRILSSRFWRLERFAGYIRRPLAGAVERLGLNDSDVFAQTVAILGAMALIAIFWRFSELIYAFSHPISEMLPEQLSALAGAERSAFRMTLTLLVLALAFSTRHAFRMRGRTYKTKGLAWPVAAAVVLGASVVLLEAPYRVFWHASFERADLGANACYIVGENRIEFLLHCPTVPPPRNRIVSVDDSGLKRRGFRQSIFQSPLY